MPHNLPDIHSIPTDLTSPATIEAVPAPGIRVRQSLPRYASTDVYHTLYLPTDWQTGLRYPVIVEYAGNGPYENEHGDACTGRVEDCSLGYGISATGGATRMTLLPTASALWRRSAAAMAAIQPHWSWPAFLGAPSPATTSGCATTRSPRYGGGSSPTHTMTARESGPTKTATARRR